ncbi:Bug family tripartite tricarboxylate transporter substrate binding protein [Bordetella genomosp. 4]|uniref:Twin-arginine translocation pathway signal protein n=1 Tax=Bordetella genomosp. 4 TaxID=463044 RepID=A0A261U857_9BORD|nr:tripartite tricarboxylate transporter substrate-binding protein [Bordetella genomosp. 4]OZI51417.1 twin-arginine translocation pathway signal protein [Bordetella genomosp. 4]OZI57602.1 twin-arginine translocation pathway signal protein [Bordetella genomosp. 4]
MNRRTLLKYAAALGAAGLVQPAWTREAPLRVVVPFPPGGGTDVLGRVIAASLEPALNRSVIVENKPGASGMLGADYTANGAKDGSILLFAGLVPSVRYYARPPEEVLKQLAPVCPIARSPYMVAVNADVPAKTLKELVEQAKAHPQDLTFGTPGNATPQHIATELMQAACGIDMLHVPYRGTGPMMTDLLGGQIQVVVATVAAVEPYLKSGRLRVLAVTSAERLTKYPDIPTVAESGYQGFAAQIQFGTYCAAGTPAEIIAALNQGVNRALQTEDVRRKLGEQGFTPTGGTPEALQTALLSEIREVAALVKSGKVKVDL